MTTDTMHLGEDDLILHYYGELEAAPEGRVTAHLAECRACHADYTRLQQVLAVVDAAPAPALPDGFERTVWARLEPALDPARRGWLSWFVFSPARVAWAAAVLALVAGAFFAGRVSHRDVFPAAQSVSSGDIRERILLVDLGEHLDRSQMMLVELVSVQPGAGVDLSAERARAQELVAANRLYRQTASATGDASVEELLDELERVLVELAASPDRMTADDLLRVQQRIDARGLLFKVRVVSTSVRERQKQAIRTRTGQSS
jgi:hypothetical protein